jgi:DNA-binding SARP family transcriptional activator
MITCRVLGPVEVSVDGAAAPPELLWRKHLALLLYLARSPKRARTREHLTGLLWPEKDESAARHSLNEALRVLRRAAGEEALDTSAGQVRLGADVVHLDAQDLDRWIAAGAWNEAAAIVAGEFLEGFAVAGSDAIEDWLGAERRHWRERSITALLGFAESLLTRGRAGEALAAARRAEALDAHSDAAARAVMSALAVLGDVAGALVQFDRFEALLAGDVDSRPADATRHLAGRIRSARGPRAAAPEIRAAEPDHRRPPLVGRGSELGQLLGLFEHCHGGRGATAIVLEGESGTGKTRLLEEFATRARLAGATVALVRTVEGDLEDPGSGVLGLARGGLLAAPGVPAAPPPALAYFAAALPEWAERFPAAAASPGQTTGHALSALLAALLEEGSVVLAVDDAQWIDRQSLLSLLAALRVCAKSRFCLVLATLPHPPREELDELRRRLGHDVTGATLALTPLDGAALRDLAAWALPRYQEIALERICRRVASDSAGIPLLATELLSAVAQGLDLSSSDSAWPSPLHTLTQSLPGDLPDTVIAAMRIGYRRLGHDAQQVLAAAAVLGDRTTESLLAKATGLATPAVQAALDELEWQRWLEADGRGYGFVARLAREVIARDMLTAGQRARVRERAGLAPAAPSRVAPDLT